MPKRKAQEGDKTYLLTLSPKTDISEACTTQVLTFLKEMRNLRAMQAVIECQTTDDHTGMVIPTKKHFHAYLHYWQNQPRTYIIDEIKKIMDKTGHHEQLGDGSNFRSRHIVVCYKYEDYLYKYDKTINLFESDEWDTDAFEDDFPDESRQQELQKKHKIAGNGCASDNIFADMEKDLRQLYGNKLYAGVIYHYVNRRINVTRDIPPMRDERTLREFVKKLHAYCNNVTMTSSVMKWCHELDKDACMDDRLEPRQYINAVKKVLQVDSLNAPRKEKSQPEQSCTETSHDEGIYAVVCEEGEGEENLRQQSQKDGAKNE